MRKSRDCINHPCEIGARVRGADDWRSAAEGAAIIRNHQRNVASGSYPVGQVSASGRGPTGRQRRQRRSVHHRQALLESLEPRLLLDADLGLVEGGLQAGFFTAIQAAVNDQVLLNPAAMVGSQLRTEPVGQFLQPIDGLLASVSLGTLPDVQTVRDELHRTLGGLIQTPVSGPDIRVLGQAGDAEIQFQLQLGGSTSGTVDLDLALGADAFLQPLLDVQDAVDVVIDWTFDVTFGVDDTDFFFVTSGADELTVQVSATVRDFFDGKGRLGIFSAEFETHPVQEVCQITPGGLVCNDEVVPRPPSTFDGVYLIDVDDTLTAAPDGRASWNPAISDPALFEFTHLNTSGTLDGSSAVHLYASASFVPEFLGDDGLSDSQRAGLFNLKVYSDISVTRDYVDAGTALFPFGNDPVIAFTNVALDTAEFLGGFFAPVVRSIRQVIGPFQPMLDFLEQPIPGLSELNELVTGKPLTVLDLASQTSGSRAQAARALQGIRLLGVLADTELPDRDVNQKAKTALGAFKVEAKQKLDGTTPEPVDFFFEEQPYLPQVVESHPFDNSAVENVKQTNQSFANLSGNLRFPLLEDPTNVFNLLQGVSAGVEMFGFGIAFELGLSWERTIPIPAIPVLNAEIAAKIGMELKLDVGFDTQGAANLSEVLDYSSRQALIDSLSDENLRLLKDSFFFSDHNALGVDGDLTADGGFQVTPGGDNPFQPESSTKDGAELKLFASISAGGSVGIGAIGIGGIKAGVRFPLTLNILFDLNDLPNPLPRDQWRDPAVTGETGIRNRYPLLDSDFTYDGKVRLSELTQIADADFLSIVNSSGELTAAFEAFAKATLGSGFFEVTLFDFTFKIFELSIFDFDVLTPIPDAEILGGFVRARTDIGDVQGGVLSLYAGADADMRRGTSFSSSGADDEIDEKFLVESLGPTTDDQGTPTGGETLIVTYQNFFKETFEGVQQVGVDLGDGDDTFIVAKGVQTPVTVRGGDGDDMLDHKGDGVAILYGDAGNDVLLGGTNDDVLIGGDDVDLTADGGFAGDQLDGRAGNDRLAGDDATWNAGTGQLLLQATAAGPGADVLKGGSGMDGLLGQHGNDILEGGLDADTITGGSGSDQYSWQVGTQADTVIEVAGDAGQDQMVIAGAVRTLGLSPDGGNVRVVDVDDVFEVNGVATGPGPADPVEVVVHTIDQAVSDFGFDHIERLSIQAGGGADRVTMSNLARTSLDLIVVDLGQGVDTASDVVLYNGTDGGDTIDVQATVEPLAASDPVSGQPLPDLEQAVVRVTDHRPAGDFNLLIMGGDPDRDRLEIVGGPGADDLAVLPGTGGRRVQDHVIVVLNGGDDDDHLSTIYANVEALGGAGVNDLTVTGDDAGTQRLAASLSTSTGDAGTLRIQRGSVSEFIHFERINAPADALTVRLGSAGGGTDFTVHSGVGGPMTIEGGGGIDGDAIAIQTLRGPATVNLAAAGPNVVTLGRNGALALLDGDITVNGGGSVHDRLVYDAHTDTESRRVEIVAFDDNGVDRWRVDGLGVPSLVKFDGSVEELELRLGSGDDALVGAAGDASAVGDAFVGTSLTRRIIINGGGGDDRAFAALTADPQGAARDLGLSTQDVESVRFRFDPDTALTGDPYWLITDDQLRSVTEATHAAGLPTPQDRIVLDSVGALDTAIFLADDASHPDHLKVLDTHHAMAIDLRDGSDAVQVGAFAADSVVADVAWPLHLDGSGGGQDGLLIDDTANTGGGQQGTLEPQAIRGFGMGHSQGIAYVGFEDLTVTLSDLTDDHVTLVDTATSVTVRTGGAFDTVDVLAISDPTSLELGDDADIVNITSAANQPLTVDGGADPGDRVILRATDRTARVTASVLGHPGNGTVTLDATRRLGGVEVELATGVDLHRVDQVELALGSNNDVVNVDEVFAGLVVIAEGGEGDDEFTLGTITGGTASFAGDAGEDTATIVVPGDALTANDYANLTVDVETLIVDNRLNADGTPNAQSVQWTVRDGVLLANAQRLLTVDGIEHILIQAGAGASDGLEVSEAAGAVEAVIDGNRVDLTRGETVLDFFGSALDVRIPGATGAGAFIPGLASAAVSPDGISVYGISRDSDALVVIDTADMTVRQVFSQGVDGVNGLLNANSVAVSPDGARVYVSSPELTNTSDANWGWVAVFDRDLVTGDLTFVRRNTLNTSLFGFGCNCSNTLYRVVVGPDSQTLYAHGDWEVQRWHINADGTMDAPGSRSVGATTVVAFALNPVLTNGFYAAGPFVQGLDGDMLVRNVPGFNLSFSPAPGVSAVAVSPDGQFIYATSATLDRLWVARDSALISTSLTPLASRSHQNVTNGQNGVRGMDGANGVAVSPDGRFVYVTGGDGDSMAVFRRDQVTGTVEFVQAIQNRGGLGLGEPNSITAAADGRVYVGSSTGLGLRDGGIAAFQLVLDNLAPGARSTASQSTTPDPAHGAEHAIDGDGLVGGSFTQTDDVAGSWWQVDLGRTSDLSRIVLHNGSIRLSNFRFLVFDGAVERYRQDYFVGSGSIAGGADLTIDLTGNLQGDRVRLEILGLTNEGSGVLSLAEVEVLGTAPPGHQVVAFENVEALTVATGRRADVIRQIEPAGVATTTIRSGAGGDAVSLLRLGGATQVDAGDDPDVIEIRSDVAGTSLVVNAEAGNDQIIVGRTGTGSTTTINAGAGNDLVRVSGPDMQSDVMLFGDPPDGTSSGDVLVFDPGVVVLQEDPLETSRPAFTTGGIPDGTAEVGAVQPDGTIVSVGNPRVIYESVEQLRIIGPASPDTGGPYAIVEGAGLTLDASGTRAFGDGPPSYVWQVNGLELITAPGASGQVKSLTWADLQALGVDDDGTCDITLRVAVPVEGEILESEATTSLTVSNFVRTVNDPAAPPTVLVGDPFTVHLASTDPGADRVREWMIDWADGTVETFGSTVATATHRYATTGELSVTLTADDEDPGTSIRAVPVSVRAPVPQTGGPYVIDELAGVTLQATVPGAPTVTWLVNGQSFAGNVGGTVALSWADLGGLGIDDDGTFGVSATASYGAGPFDSAVGDTTLQVLNAAPRAAMTSAGPVSEGELAVVMIENPVDATPDELALFTYSFDLDNDGTFEVGPGPASSASVIATRAGAQLVGGRIHDKDGGERDFLTAVTVREVAPTLTLGGDASVDEGVAYALDLSATDPGADSISHWFVNWGDGTHEDAAGPTATLSHTYPDDGTVSIEVVAVDDDGIYRASRTIDVLNVAPTLLMAGNSAIDEGGIYVLGLARVSDPGDDTIESWTIDWGDGSDPETVAGAIGAVSHLYADDSGAGPLRITATATDEDGTYAVEGIATLAQPLARFTEGPDATDNYYVLTSAARSYMAAQAEAEQFGGWLADVTGQAEQDFIDVNVARAAGPGADLWIGLAGAVVYAEDFEDGPGGFTFDNGDSGSIGNWHHSNGRRSDGDPNHSPPDNLYYGLGETATEGGRYGGSAFRNYAAISPPIALPAGRQVELRFNTLSQLQLFYNDVISVVVNDGQSSTTVLASNAGGARALPSDTGGAWQTINTDLSMFAGRDIQIRFTMRRGNTSGSGLEGWFVDDVFLVDTTPVTPRVVEAADLALAWDAADPGSDPSMWSPDVGSGVAWQFTGTTTPVLDTALQTNRDLTDAFVFAGDGTATADTTFDDFGSATTTAASFELWLKPDDLLGNHVIFEAGGAATGTSLRLEDDALIFRVKDGPTVVESVARLGPDDVADMVQVVATLQPGSGSDAAVALHVNGRLRDSASPGAGASILDWADGDPSALGGWAGAVGGDVDTTDFSGFVGAIAQMRFYGQALASTTVSGNFLAVAAPNGIYQWSSGAGLDYVNFAGGQPQPGLAVFTTVLQDDGTGRWHAQTVDASPRFAVIEMASLAGLPSSIAAGLDLTVRNLAPSTVPGGAAAVAEGANFTLALAAPTDPGEDVVGQYRINWGDGTPVQVVDAPPATAEGFVPALTVDHVFADGDGDRVVAVSLVDEDGTHANDVTLDVRVDNVAPSILLGGPVSAEQGATYTLQLEALFDPGNDTVSQFIVDWGDGSAPDTPAGPGAATHLYGTAGPHTIEIDLVDEDGTYEAVDTLTLLVTQVAFLVPLTGAADVDEGVPYALTIGAAVDPADPQGVPTVDQYVVHWGDGTSDVYATPGAVTHAYADGPFAATISVDLVTPAGTFANVGSLAVQVDNAAPVITGTPSTVGQEATTAVVVTVAAGDTGGAGDPLTYRFDFDDDGLFEVTNFTGVAEHLFNDRGTYPVTVEVLDDDGGMATTTFDVSVDNLDPVISSVSDDGPVFERTPVTVTVVATDAAGVDDPLLFEFDFDDDGTYEASSATGLAQHVYPGGGVYDVPVRVTDGDGGEALDSIELTVLHVVPTDLLIVSDGPVPESSPVTVTATAGDADDPGLPLDYAFDLDGDGTFEVTNTTGVAIHTYADDGVYAVDVRVTDDDGAVTTGSIDVTVDNVAPTVRIVGAASSDEAGLYSLLLSAQDPGADTITSWEITWGDGTVDTLPATATSASHRFVDDSGTGTFRLTATVTDEDGVFPVTEVVRPSQPLFAFTEGPGATGHLYTLTSSAMQHRDAAAQAANLGGALATIDSAEEQAFVRQAFLGEAEGPDAVWIGLAKQGSVPPIGAESEPNDDGNNVRVNGDLVDLADLPLADDVTGSFVPIGADTFQAVVLGKIDAINDADWDFYRVVLSPGDTLDVLVEGRSVPPERDLRDPVIILYDETGDAVSSGFQGRMTVGGPGWFGYEGDYYVLVDGNNNTFFPPNAEHGNYTMTVTLTSARFAVVAPKEVIAQDLALAFDAADPGAVGTAWSPNVGGGLAWEFTGPSAPTSGPVAGTARSFDTAFTFSGDSVATANPTFDGFQSATTRDTTLTFWLKPTDLQGREVVFEAGGADSGTSLRLEDDQLVLRVKDGPVTLETDATLSQEDVSDLVQVVAVIETGTGVDAAISLHVNGQLRSGAAAADGQSLLDWADADASALGGVAGEPGGGIGPTGLTGFNGEIEYVSLYQAALDTAAVVHNFLAGATPYADFQWDDGTPLGYVDFAGGHPTINGPFIALANDDADGAAASWRTQPRQTALFGLAELDGVPNFGVVADDGIDVSVRNLAPTIQSVGGDDPVEEGTPVTVTVAATDVAGAADPLQFAFDFDGDGAFEQSNAGGMAQHVFAAGGLFPVAVRVTDGDGGETTAGIALTITEAGPIDVTVTSTGPVDEGSAVEVTAAATDADGTSGALSYAFDFDGDGAFETVNGTGVAAHTFADDGVFPVSVRITDDDGGETLAGIDVTVNNVAPVLAIRGASTADEGAPYTLLLSRADPGDDTLTWHIDWGDGTGSDVPGSEATATHVFAHDSGAGRFLISASGSDEDGTWDLAGVATLQRPAIAFDEGDGATGHLYLLTPAALPFADAEADAVSLGGHLASIGSPAEQAFLDDHFVSGSAGQAPLRVGLTREPDAMSVLYAEDFGGGGDGITIDNTFGDGGGLWHASTGRQADGDPNHSAPGSLYYGQNETDFAGGGYDTAAFHAGAAITPVIALPDDGRDLKLALGTLIDVDYFDDLRIMLDDGGPEGPAYLASAPGSLPNYTGSAWQRLDFDLNAFAGRDVQLRFEFQTGSDSSFGEGWFIDDVVVTATPHAVRVQDLVMAWDAAVPGTQPDSEWQMSGGSALSGGGEGKGGPPPAWWFNSPAPVLNTSVTSNRDLTAAFDFDGTDVAELSTSLVGAQFSLTRAALEFWVRPTDLAGNELLFETGNNSAGASLRMEDDQLIFLLEGANFESSDTVTVEARTTLSADDISDFVQVVVEVFRGAGTALYVNGRLRDAAPLGPGEFFQYWIDFGDDATGLGGAVGEIGGDVDPADVGGFEGQIARMNFYRFGTLDGPGVAGNFLAVADAGAAYRWTSGEAVAFVNFGGGQPAGDGGTIALVDAGDGTSRWQLTDDGLSHFGIIEVDSLEDLPLVPGNGFEVAVRSTNGTGPVVTAVAVGSSQWSAAFTGALGGDAYTVPAGPDQLASLPWPDLDRISLVFSEDVQVAQADLQVAGVNVADYATTGFSYDPATFTATWTLGTAPEVDTVRLVLSDRVTDAPGNALDGEWVDGVSTRSGDGVPGGAFAFRANVLLADANRDGVVSVRDVAPLRTAANRAAGNAAYSLFADLTGSGAVGAADAALLRARIGSRLPDGEPQALSSVLASADAEVDLLAAMDRRAVVARIAARRGDGAIGRLLRAGARSGL